MDPRIQLGRVVDHGEFERRIELAVATGERQRDALFELRRVDRVVEAHRHDGLFRRRVLRILIELGGTRLGDKRCDVEGQMVIRHQHVRGESLLDVESQLDMGANRPVRGGHEAQRAIVCPAPLALQGRRHRNAFGDCLADQFDRRCRAREVHFQRMNRDLGRAVRLHIVRDGGHLGLKGNPFRLRGFRTMRIPVPAGHCRDHQHDDAEQAAGEAPGAAADRRASSQRPCGSRPRDAAEDRPSNLRDKAEQAAYQTQRQNEQKSQNIHASLIKDKLAASYPRFLLLLLALVLLLLPPDSYSCRWLQSLLHTVGFLVQIALGLFFMLNASFR